MAGNFWEGLHDKKFLMNSLWSLKPFGETGNFVLFSAENLRPHEQIGFGNAFLAYLSSSRLDALGKDCLIPPFVRPV